MTKQVIELLTQLKNLVAIIILITYISNLIKIQAFVAKVNKKVNDAFHDDFP